MMVQALSVIQYVMIFNLFGISLRLVATSETQEKTHERQLVDNDMNVFEKIDRDQVGIRGNQLVHGGRLQQMRISRALHKKSTHDEKMGTNSKLRQKKMIHDDLPMSMMGNVVRRRRGLGYWMQCVPTTKKVCKNIKYKGQDTQWCIKIVYKKCSAID